MKCTIRQRFAFEFFRKTAKNNFQPVSFQFFPSTANCKTHTFSLVIFIFLNFSHTVKYSTDLKSDPALLVCRFNARLSGANSMNHTISHTLVEILMGGLNVYKRIDNVNWNFNTLKHTIYNETVNNIIKPFPNEIFTRTKKSATFTNLTKRLCFDRLSHEW